MLLHNTESHSMQLLNRERLIIGTLEVSFILSIWSADLFLLSTSSGVYRLLMAWYPSVQ